MLTHPSKICYKNGYHSIQNWLESNIQDHFYQFQQVVNPQDPYISRCSILSSIQIFFIFRKSLIAKTFLCPSCLVKSSKRPTLTPAHFWGRGLIFIFLWLGSMGVSTHMILVRIRDTCNCPDPCYSYSWNGSWINASFELFFFVWERQALIILKLIYFS